jgi:resuscitation-promoting factor RpfB
MSIRSAIAVVLAGVISAPAAALACDRGHLRRIVACESRGNPRAVSRDGLYHGLFQFDLVTWRSVGGRGSPSSASVSEQWLRACKLYDRRGAQPWPVCGRL